MGSADPYLAMGTLPPSCSGFHLQMGDPVYGYDELRLWLDEPEKNYVLAVPETHMVWVQAQQQPVGLLAAL